jgi:hypothetical protein
VPATKADPLPERVGKVFDARGAGYAIRHEAAAQRYCPFLSSVSQVRARLLIGSNADGGICAARAAPKKWPSTCAKKRSAFDGQITTLDGYSGPYTLDCERVLVTLLRGLGPGNATEPRWAYKTSVWR